MDVEGLSDAAKGIMIMSSREVVSFPGVNIANAIEDFQGLVRKYETDFLNWIFCELILFCRITMQTQAGFFKTEEWFALQIILVGK